MADLKPLDTTWKRVRVRDANGMTIKCPKCGHAMAYHRAAGHRKECANYGCTCGHLKGSKAFQDAERVKQLIAERDAKRKAREAATPPPVPLAFADDINAIMQYIFGTPLRKNTDVKKGRH